MRRPTVLLATSLLLLVTIAAPAATAVDEPDLNRVIVEVRAGTDTIRGIANEAAALHGGRTGATFRHALDGFVAELSPKAIAALARDPRVIRITPDYKIRIAAEETSTGFDRVEADLIHTGSVPLTDVDIAIIDTGVSDHPDLNVVHRVDCSNLFGICTDNAGFDGNGHGTHIAGVAAAIDNEIGIIGIAPGARIWSVKVLGADGTGYLSSLVSGIDWVTGRAAEIDVANMSLTGEFTNATFDTAISNSVAAGITYAVAAGNGGVDAASYSPASHPEVITVSAVGDADGAGGRLGVFFNRPAESDDVFATFSNHGEVVDLAAPGVNLRSTWLGDGYAIKSGTSVASPMVAGAAALYVAASGRDANNDGQVDGADVARVRSDLIARAIPQTDDCGFDGDPDVASFREPLLNVDWDSYGGSGRCNVATADSSAPSSPSFTAVADGFTTQVDWSAATDPESGILTYQLWRDSVMITETDHTVFSFLDRGDPGAQYSYEMVATNRQGIASAPSGPITVMLSDDDPTDAGWWAFDDGAGTVAADGTAWHREGTVIGNAAWEPAGKLGGALSFGGTTSRVDLDSAILDDANDVTVALWLRTQKTGIQAFVSGANASNDAEFELVPISSNSVRFYTGEATGSYVVWSVASFADNQWHHFALTRDGAGDTIELFIDGVSQGTRSATLNPLTIDPGGLLLGQEQDSVGGGFDASQAFVGDMDEVRLYTRILTNSEIGDLLNGGPDTTPPGAPAGLLAAAGDEVVELDWDDSGEIDLAGYSVYRATISGGPYESLASDLAVSEYTDTAVANGTPYYYVVTATDTSDNESANSLEASATPDVQSGPIPIDFDLFEVTSYGGSAQDKTGSVEILDDGATLRLTGNLWKKISYPYQITPNTVIEFDFSSATQGEIHGIGFDTDNGISSSRTFELYGTQRWGIQNYRTYPSVTHYTIPIGQFYTGAFPYLFFAMDHDISNPTGQSTFSNITIYESG